MDEAVLLASQRTRSLRPTASVVGLAGRLDRHTRSRLQLGLLVPWTKRPHVAVASAATSEGRAGSTSSLRRRPPADRGDELPAHVVFAS